jgi:hypothetical protein
MSASQPDKPKSVTQSDALPSSRVSGRAIGLAIVISVAANLWVNYIEYVIHASRMTLSHFPMGALMPYLSLVLILNPLCRRIVRRYALSSTELLVVLAGGLVGGAIPSVGLTGYFLGAIAAPYYFATPENQWAEFFHPHIPEWLAPRNVGGTLDHLFEGLPPGDPIPWTMWFVPIASWMAVITALFVASVCLAVILRKQWVESERLTYPILRPVLDLTQNEGSRFPRTFWIGFAVALGIISWNMVRYFVPGFPEIPNIRWGPWVHFQRYYPGIWTRVNMFTISFAYFANIDVLFSLWFFCVLFILRSGILNRYGYNASGQHTTSGEFAWLQFGAFFMLVFWSLWTARGHLRSVFRKAFGLKSGLDESEEMMRYRTALLGFAMSVSFAVLWFWRAGMGAGVALLYVMVTLVIYLGVSRIVADVGLVFVCTPVGAQGAVTYAVGAKNLSGPSLTVLAFSNAFASFGKGLFMPAATHAAKIADACPGSDRSKVLTGIILAFAAGAAASIVYTLYLGYTVGAYNFNDFPFTRYSRSGFNSALSQMKDPPAETNIQMVLFCIGAVVMSALTFLKYRFPWWPLHPVGFTIAGISYVHFSTFSVFIAWAIKYIILRIGGAGLYRRYTPFFLGVLVGYTAGVGLSIFVDIIWFSGAGHGIHGY